MPESISFGALVGLMVHGPDHADTDVPDSVRGEIEIRNGDRSVRYRIHRRGELSRRETVDGVVRLVEGVRTVWTRNRDDDAMIETPRIGSSFGHAGSHLGSVEVGGERPSWTRWDGSDHTVPTGPVTATQFLGRAAWIVELAASIHKQHPLTVTVDAATGLLLRSVEADEITQWTSFEVGLDLAAELFTWTGPSQPPVRTPEAQQHEDQLAQRREWLEQRGLVASPILLTPALLLHAWDESGAFHLTFDATIEGTVLRRPSSVAPWPEAERVRWPHVYRWSDGTWDWLIGSDTEVTPEQLEQWRLRGIASR